MASPAAAGCDNSVRIRIPGGAPWRLCNGGRWIPDTSRSAIALVLERTTHIGWWSRVNFRLVQFKSVQRMGMDGADGGNGCSRAWMIY
jgi:hypothetical protein